jgi:hypothetical protein
MGAVKEISNRARLVKEILQSRIGSVMTRRDYSLMENEIRKALGLELGKSVLRELWKLVPKRLFTAQELQLIACYFENSNPVGRPDDVVMKRAAEIRERIEKLRCDDEPSDDEEKSE